MSLSSKSGQNSSAHYEANIGAKCVMFISLCKNVNFELRYYFQKRRQLGGQFIFFCLCFTKTLRSSEWSNTIVKSFLFYFSIWNFFLFWRHKVKKNMLWPPKKTSIEQCTFWPYILTLCGPRKVNDVGGLLIRNSQPRSCGLQSGQIRPLCCP